MFTGALPDLKDERDFKAEPLMASSLPVDFSQEFFLPKPPLWNQQASDSCVGASWSYYHWQLTGKDYSVKSVFAYIAQQYGAYIRDGGLRIVKFGQETQDETPDPEIRTPISMRDKIGLNEIDALDDRELSSFSLNNSIDECAKCVRDYKGAVFGVTGSDEGWIDHSNPRPPASGEPIWGHALYLYGYHLHDGLKCVVARSSWSENDHHIKENYFESGNSFNPWTLIRKEQMARRFYIKDGAKIGVFVADGFALGGGFAKDAGALESLKSAFEFKGDEPILELPPVQDT